MPSRLWNFLTTDIRDLVSAETITEETDAAGVVLELAIALQEEGTTIEQLAPLVGRISTLLDALNSPLEEIVGAGVPFVFMGAKLLAFYLEKSQKQPTLEQCVAIISQVAYLESFREFLKNEDLLNRLGQTPVSETVRQRIKQLEELELDYRDAESAVACFRESELAAKFGRVLSARLENAGLEEKDAEILTQRVAWNTRRYTIEAWAQSPEAVKHLGQPYFREWQEEREMYQSIDNYLAEQIAAKPLERVFGENFTFRDIYVPLKAKSINENGEVDEGADAFDLETWAINILERKQPGAMFVQAGPGRGKSVFCRMFADWVRQHFYPIWIPVLIRLRDISKWQPSFRETLLAAIEDDFPHNEKRLLANFNTQYLFLLDEFDELPIEGRTSGGLEDFLGQMGQFQRAAYESRHIQHHRVLIVRRTLALQGAESQVPSCEGVRIEVMDDQLQQQWLEKWEGLVGARKRVAFEGFLQDERCPERVRELAREPLLLHQLAAMHRDGWLQVKDFEGASSTGAKILIYEQFLDWMLTKQCEEWLQRKLTERDTDSWRRILLEAGLCATQLGGESVSLKAIESRLRGDPEAKGLLKEAEKCLGENPLGNVLAAFDLQKGTKEGSVEFAHKSFSEFLFAERLKNSLLEWTELGKKGKRFDIPEERLNWEIYDLLGSGALTEEIVKYLMELLVASEEFRPVCLFERLDDFYIRWCNGEFIDEIDELDDLPENLPQKKNRRLRKQGINRGLRQVDVYAGLNVMILLLELHRYAREDDELRDNLVFYVRRKPGEAENPTRLFRIIGYSRCIGDFGFRDTVGQFLRGVNFRSANLSGANLSGANLIKADLTYANLSGANLSSANLSSANLSGVHLRSVDLDFSGATSVDFSGAHLRHAHLSGNLRGADFRRADMRFADLSGANLGYANLGYANLNQADLHEADLHEAYLRGTNLMEADLRGAHLKGAILMEADLRGAHLKSAHLTDANLMKADLGSANLTDAGLSVANLSGADLSGADLTDADLTDADLSGADLRSADLTGADLSGTDFSDRLFGDVQWNEDTKWENVRGLEAAVNVPEALKQQLSANST